MKGNISSFFHWIATSQGGNKRGSRDVYTACARAPVDSTIENATQFGKSYIGDLEDSRWEGSKTCDAELALQTVQLV